MVLRDTVGKLIDAASRHLGMRSFRIDEESTPKGCLYLNGREIRLRGDFDQLAEDHLVVKFCTMNFLRLSQRQVQLEIYYPDMLGVMLQSDLSFFSVVRRNTVCVAIRQAAEMERVVRNSPAIAIDMLDDAVGIFQTDHAVGALEERFHFHALQVLLGLAMRFLKGRDHDAYDPPCASLPDNHCHNIWYNGHGLDLGKLHKGYWIWVKPGWMYACGEFGAEGLEDESLMRKSYPREWLPWTPEEAKNLKPDFDREGPERALPLHVVRNREILRRMDRRQSAAPSLGRAPDERVLPP